MTPIVEEGSGPSFIRVASISIALYDYLLTLPAEWRFYRGQRLWKMSPGCILFILIRYVSIITLTVSNVGFFGSFSEPACQHYYLAAPVLKVLQSMVSQIVLGIRTLNISRRHTGVMWTLIVVFVCCTTVEWFTNLWHRIAVQAHHNCTAGNVPSHLSVWLYYLVTMVYDVVTLGISSFYLLRFKPPAGSRMSHLVKVMLHDGLVYFIALTGVNIFNLILYRTTDETTQSSGASLGYTITWIMSQRILIHLRDAAAEHNRMPTTHIVVSRPLTSARSVSQAMRSQFESKVRIDDHFSTSGVVVVSHAGEDESRVSDLDLEHGDFDVQVQIEESVAVEYDSQAFERESYRTPRLMWEERSRAS